MSEDYFTVIAHRSEDEQKAKLLQAMVNRPEVVARIMDEVQKRLEEHMNEILYGKLAERGKEWK